jgi:hypothetical protein
VLISSFYADHTIRRQQVDTCRGQNVSVRHPYVCLLILLVYGVIFETTTFTRRSKHSPESLTNKIHSTPQSLIRASNLEIIRKATPLDIVFQNVAQDRTKDPHRGALDELGQWGYRPDPAALRNNPLDFNLTGNALDEACKIRDSEYKMIHDKVSIDSSILGRKQVSDHHPKIICVVQTSGHRHWDRIPALRRTWG